MPRPLQPSAHDICAQMQDILCFCGPATAGPLPWPSCLLPWSPHAMHQSCLTPIPVAPASLHGPAHPLFPLFMLLLGIPWPWPHPNLHPRPPAVCEACPRGVNDRAVFTCRHIPPIFLPCMRQASDIKSHPQPACNIVQKREGRCFKEGTEAPHRPTPWSPHN